MARGWFDRRVQQKALFDPESDRAGVQDQELPIPAQASVTAAQELPAFIEGQVAGGMVGMVEQ